MLTQIISASTTISAPPKQIVLDFSGSDNTILYTVPAGRTCTGTFFGKPSSNGAARINGPKVWFSSSSTPGTNPVVAVLIAGTVLAATSSDGNCTFVGVEE
jgi:hypothetical protein